MSLSPLTFTGVSTYSQDFQTILTRATSIASLPIKALQNQQTDLVQKKLLLTNINTGVDSLASSIKNLGTIAAKKALVASSSNSAKVTATNVSSAAPTTYTISEITSISKSAAETSVTGYADTTATAVSATGTVELKVGSNTYSLDLTGNNNLTGLRDAINALGAGVRATVLTTGTGANPFYLSVTANEAGAKALELHDDPGGANTSLLTANNQGANTEFKLNGVFISKKSNLINDVVPGVTFNILGTTSGAETVSVSVASNRDQVSGALQTFVDSYNSLREQVSAQVGSNAGLLTGDFIVREVQSRLRTITSYQGSGAIKSLTDLGVTFDTNGKASFDTSTFNSLSDSQINSTFDFLGSESSGFGAFGARLNEISDSVTGFAKIQIDKYEETDKRINDQVSILTARVLEMQKTLSSKLQVADALLASLQSQQQVLTSTIDGLNAHYLRETKRMNRLPALIQAIEKADAALNGASLADGDALLGCLNQRAQLIRQAAELIDEIRKSGQLVSPETGVALRRSQVRGNQSLRQLILAKHQIATQLTQLKQEQLLLSDLTEHPETPSRICDVMG